MEAAAPYTATARIGLAAITISKTNPRKHFDKAALDELTESVKKLDVLQPILVRPNGGAGKYELVAGERRYRAAKAAGLTDIPATVRVLTDAEVAEVQLVENLQRADLHELEEAEGYEQLLKCAHADGKKYTAEEIAAKVGKSRSYVFGRLKLTALCPEARKAFYDGKIDASKALLIARIGHHDTQRQALKDLTESRYGREPMSYREAHQHILQNFMLQLKAAPFDIKDEKLLPKAGDCIKCPKRTGNQADLFGDVKSADVCTDPKCFDDKRQAHYSVAVKDLEAKGNKVVAGDAAKKAFPEWDSGSNYSRDRLQGGYVSLEETTYATGRGKKVGDLLGVDYKPVLIQHPGTGQIVKAATQQAITAAAAKVAKQQKGSKGASKKKHSGPGEAKPDPAQILRKKLFAHVFAALPKKLGAEELRWIAGELMVGDADFDLIAELFLAPTKGQTSYGAAQRRIEAALPKLDADGLSRLLVALYITNDWEGEKRVAAAAKLYGVDLAAVKKAIADEAKPSEKSAPAKKKAKKS